MSTSSNYYDALAKSYEVISLNRNEYLIAVDSFVTDAIKLAQPKTLLDIGSGDGKRILKLTENTDIQVWALENSHEMYSILCKSIAKSRIFKTDIACISELTENFDVITALWNVFGHIGVIDHTFDEIRGKLKPGGIFIFDVNNPFNVAEYGLRSSFRNLWKSHVLRESLSFNLQRDGVTTDVHFRTLGYYKSKLHRAGFARIRVRYVNYNTGKQTNRFRGQFYFECS